MIRSAPARIVLAGAATAFSLGAVVLASLAKPPSDWRDAGTDALLAATAALRPHRPGDQQILKT